MFLNWHYIEIIVALALILSISYIVIRFNREQNDEDIIPEAADGDVLASSDAFVQDSGEVHSAAPLGAGEYIGKVRVISEEEARKKMENRPKHPLQNTRKYTIPHIVKQHPTEHKQQDTPKNTIIAIHVLAQPDQVFAGYELYQSLTSAGLTFGAMKIFHRYAECSKETDQILFSVASAVNPGIIDANNIGAFTTPGLILFMDYSKIKNAASNFQLMLNTAKLLAEDLHGLLLDAQRQPWTLAFENECRRRIQHYNMHIGRPVGAHDH